MEVGTDIVLEVVGQQEPLPGWAGGRGEVPVGHLAVSSAPDRVECQLAGRQYLAAALVPVTGPAPW